MFQFSICLLFKTKAKRSLLLLFYFLTSFVCFISFFEKETKIFQTETQLSNARCPPRRSRGSPDRCDYAGRCIEKLCSRWRYHRLWRFRPISTINSTGYEKFRPITPKVYKLVRKKDSSMHFVLYVYMYIYPLPLSLSCYTLIFDVWCCSCLRYSHSLSIYIYIYIYIYIHIQK